MNMQHGEKQKGAGRPKGQNEFGEQTIPMCLLVSLIKSVLKFVESKKHPIPLYGSKVAAGFPSPADDYIETHLDLNEYLIKHPAATFFVRAKGNSMINAGIHENDILIIDRSIPPTSGKIVIAAIDGQLTVKRLHIKNNKLILLPKNQESEPIEVNENNEVYIWGIVTNVIHTLG
jgi:DNA polymerase V